MWRTLSNEAREAIGRLCEQHGRHLYDYCRTGLSASDAELAVAGALLSAHVHRERLRDRELLRPWLYALARCHRASVAATRPASTGSWTRPGAPDLVADALRALDAPHRELLDLSVRHELASAEIAAIFDVEAIQVNTMIAEAADRLEEWIAAVRAARTRGGCPKLAVRVTDWAKAPGRRNRSRIARHIRSCQTCQAAPRGDMRAGVLLLDLVPAEIPETLRDQPAWGDPLPADPAAWRSDGFPVQARDLMEPPPALISLVPGPTTETRAPSWPVAGAAATGQEPSGPPEPDEPERPRRGPTAPPGTAEALLRALHQPGERLMTAGQTDSSGDTIPYRKRGDFPPFRIPAQRRDPAQEDTAPRTAPPHWGAARTRPSPSDRVRHPPSDHEGTREREREEPHGWHTPPPDERDPDGHGDVEVPAPRRSDDPPRQHAPLRTLDPGWRSGRSPATQYGDKLVFSAPVVERATPAREGDYSRHSTAPGGRQDSGDGGDGGENWDEFWRDRPDEDDPEARISLQWLVRAALIVGVVMLVAGLVWAGVRQRDVSVHPASTTPGTGAPADSGGSGAPSDTGASQAPAGPEAQHEGAHPWTSQVPSDARRSTTAKAAPAPPKAAISPSSVQLGERRSGTFELSCTGDCEVTSFSGSNGIVVSGNRFEVRVPASRPGCAGPPVTESGMVTVHWTGTATGDGTTTEGTTTADGTLTLMVSWTVTSDRGAFIPDTNGGGHWSNCPRD